ncbi:integrase core domain-containing protein [Caulobacter ginsengisoli]|nr:integrase core domain-containing protein [Caulobacter ginsengisoli]
MDQRLRFVADCLAGQETIVDVCARYGISRKTGYKWLGRYEAQGGAGLAERSHAPLAHGTRTDQALVDALLQLKAARPKWGPRKLIGRLKLDHPQLAWPSASTAGGYLKQAGLVGMRHRRYRAQPTPGGLTMPAGPNDVWAVDYKGWMMLGDGRRCEPLTITDLFSRYLVTLSAGGSVRGQEARPWFEEAFEINGLPLVIRSDNGSPFASTGITGLTSLSAWWISLGIRPERITPGRPQQNGSHERFHLTLLEAMNPPAANRNQQAKRFDAFREDFNTYRPHEALGQIPPSQLYKASPRKFSGQPPDPKYPDGATLRQVRTTGEIKWRGELVQISKALKGQTLLLEENNQGGWMIIFYDYPLGVIDRATNRLEPLSDPNDDQNL